MKKINKVVKKVFGTILAASIMFTTFSVNADAKTQYPFRNEYKSANEMAELCWTVYNKGQFGPIIMSEADLTNNGETKHVYLFVLCGTELREEQSTGLMEDLLAGFQNPNNAYTKNVVNLIKTKVPEDSNLMLVGHSLGGMIVQTVASNQYVKDHYNVLNSLTFGSPLVHGCCREGMVKRLGDTADFVPYLSVTGNLIRQIGGLNREDGGYGKGIWTFKKGWAAHNGSYVREEVWGKYDAIGVKNGDATLKLDLSTTHFEQSPSHTAWYSLNQMSLEEDGSLEISEIEDTMNDIIENK